MNDNTADRNNRIWMEPMLRVLGPFKLSIDQLALLQYHYEEFMELIALSHGCAAGDVIDMQMSATLSKTRKRHA